MVTWTVVTVWGNIIWANTLKFSVIFCTRFLINSPEKQKINSVI